MICFLFLFPEFGLHSGPETPTYASFSLLLLLDRPPYWHQLGFVCSETTTELENVGDLSSILEFNFRCL
jgi:hypothetical protein